MRFRPETRCIFGCERDTCHPALSAAPSPPTGRGVMDARGSSAVLRSLFIPGPACTRTLASFFDVPLLWIPILKQKNVADIAFNLLPNWCKTLMYTPVSCTLLDFNLWELVFRFVLTFYFHNCLRKKWSIYFLTVLKHVSFNLRMLSSIVTYPI